MESDVAGAGAGLAGGGDVGRADLAGGAFDGEGGDGVVAEIADDEKEAVGGEGGAVRVGAVLALGVGAVVAEGRFVEVDGGDGGAEGAVGQDFEGGDGAAVVVGDVDGLARGMNTEIAGAGTAGGGLAEEAEGTVGGGEVGLDGGGLAVAFVDGIEEALVTNEAPGEERGAHARRGQGDGREGTCGGVKAGGVNALGAGVLGIGAEIDLDGRVFLRGLWFAGEKTALGVERSGCCGQQGEETAAGDH